MPPKVSILIPTYNRAHYLGEALQSALTQTHPNFEVIVLDDASPDETPLVVAEFASDPRLHYIRHSSNLGLTDNWKAAIQAATGEFFCFLEDDDIWESDFVEKMQSPLLDHDELILTFCDHWVINEEGQILLKTTEQVSQFFHRHTLQAGIIDDFVQTALVDLSIGLTAAMFRRSMVPSAFLDARAKGGADLWLYYQCVKTGYKAYYLPQRYMRYRAHSAGMSQSMPTYMAAGHVFTYNSILKDQDMVLIHAAIQEKLQLTLRSWGVALLQAGQYHEARRILWAALQCRVAFKSVAAYLLTYAGKVSSLLLNSHRLGKQLWAKRP